MVRFFLTAVVAAFTAAAASGCTTAAFAPTATDVPAYAIKSVSMSGVAPQAISEAVSADLVSAIRSATPKSGASAVQMTVAISGFSGGRVATGYKAAADVSVTLKLAAGGRVVQTATFHEEAVSADEAHANRQLSAAIASRVRRNVDLPPSVAATASSGTRRESGDPAKSIASRPAAPQTAPAASRAARPDPALSSDALNTLMHAAGGTDVAPKDETRTGSLPGQTVPVPDAACSGDSLSACPQGSLLSGDFSLRK